MSLATSCKNSSGRKTDADNGLNIAINKIRLALDDSVSQPRYIQTVPRRGYRFIGEIQPAVPSGPAKDADPEPGPVHPQRQGDGGVPGWPTHRLRAAGLTVAGLLTLSFVAVARG